MSLNEHVSICARWVREGWSIAEPAKPLRERVVQENAKSSVSNRPSASRAACRRCRSDTDSLVVIRHPQSEGHLSCQCAARVRSKGQCCTAPGPGPLVLPKLLDGKTSTFLLAV